MNEPFITDIQKYSIHDGVGIRTTIFFKGCPLSCIWCHNPETQQFTKQLLFQEEKCTGCGYCLPACPRKAISIINKKAVTDDTLCNSCGSCIEECLQNIRETSGKYLKVDDLVREIEKDRVFYEKSNGGVTLSGGEVLVQDSEYINELLMKLNRRGYRVNIDTCGYAPFDVIQNILPYVDTFLYDLKIMDPDLHRKFTGVDNELILNNLKQLSKAGASIWIRIPVIGGVNDTEQNMKQTAEFLRNENINIKQINLLPYHNTGSAKYKRLNKEYEGTNFTVPDTEKLMDYSAIFKKYGFDNIKIGG